MNTHITHLHTLIRTYVHTRTRTYRCRHLHTHIDTLTSTDVHGHVHDFLGQLRPRRQRLPPPSLLSGVTVPQSGRVRLSPTTPRVFRKREWDRGYLRCDLANIDYLGGSVSPVRYTGHGYGTRVTGRHLSSSRGGSSGVEVSKGRDDFRSSVSVSFLS